MDGASAYYDIRLDTALLELLDRMLRRFGLEFLRGAQIRHQSQMNGHAVLLRKLPLKLADGFHERLGLHVSHRTADFSDDDIVLPCLSEKQHSSLDFVGDMRDDLHGLAQIRAFTLLVYDSIVYLAGSDIVRLRSMHAEKTLVMSEIQVCLGSVVRHVALPVLIRIQRTRVHIYIRVEFLYRHPQSPGLQKFGQRR